MNNNKIDEQMLLEEKRKSFRAEIVRRKAKDKHSDSTNIQRDERAFPKKIQLALVTTVIVLTTIAIYRSVHEMPPMGKSIGKQESVPTVDSNIKKLRAEMMVLGEDRRQITTSFQSQAKLSCKDSYSKAIYLTQESTIPIIVPSPHEPSRGEFEKKENFQKRIAFEEDLELDIAKKAASELASGNLVKFIYNFSPSSLKYDPDEEILNITSNPVSKGEFKSKNGKRTLLLIEQIVGDIKVTPYKLGAKTSYGNYFGVAYSTKLSNAYLNGRAENLSFSVAPSRAKQLKERLSFVVMGSFLPPYMYEKYISTDDLATMTMYRFNSKYVILNVSCAVLVDNVTNELILEIK